MGVDFSFRRQKIFVEIIIFQYVKIISYTYNYIFAWS